MLESIRSAVGPLMHDHRVRVGRAVEAGPFRVGEIAYRGGLRQSTHAHADATATLVIAGACLERVGSREDLGTPLSVVVKPRGVEHANDWGPRDARTIQLRIRADYIESLAREGIEIGPWRWLHGAPVVREFLAFRHLIRDARGPSEEVVVDRVLDLLGALGECAGSPAGVPPPSWLAHVKESLDDRITDGVRVSRLAEEAGVHPVSLTRAFRRHFGVSVTEYRRRERLRRAARTVERCPATLSRIAYRAGYADQSHFCREFKDATGLTPGEFRRLARTLGG
ncbi:MAG: helix-turn-helix domain-containing protein [Gemmatimonadota bacterium]